jgi:hypothetical protein
MDSATSIGTVDCACVIHGNVYSWDYVERLYHMLCRHLSAEVKLHVYTEDSRSVPAPMIKHSLTNWNLQNPKKTWWYKMQLFNPEHFSGPLLYFDLDLVIINNIDWIRQLPQQYFWAVRDFKYLWRPTHYAINSSIMYWDTRKFGHVWQKFVKEDFGRVLQHYHGDQDYISDKIDTSARKFLDQNRVQSWRWQALDGGYDFPTKKHKNPKSGTTVDANTSVLVFHGNPKPHEIKDPIIVHHWQ